MFKINNDKDTALFTQKQIKSKLYFMLHNIRKYLVCIVLSRTFAYVKFKNKKVMKKITRFLNNFFKETEEGCYQPESDVKTDPPMDEKQQYLLPIVGNTYWMIDAYGDVHRVQYRDDLLMNKMLHNCNLFPTKNDALRASFAAKNARIIVFNKLK